MSPTNRRAFLHRSLGAGVALGLGARSTAGPRARPLGANDAIHLAIVGLRKKGIQHIDVFRQIPGVRVTALCDADTQFIDLQKARFDERHETVKTYVDYRKLLEDRDVDAVVVATPDHWHALMMVWACQAGKDVYIEKPASWSLWEGRQMVEAARKHGRIVQVGSQNRSDEGLREVFPWLQAGNLGDIRAVRNFSFFQRSSIGRTNGPQRTPVTVDYDLFQGPASLEPLRRRQLHYHWHWSWDTGTGELGNLGAHLIDQARWALGQDTLSTRVFAIGGRFGYDDDGETPNTLIVYVDFEPVPMTYEIHGLPRAKGSSAMGAYRHLRAGTYIDCEGGYFAGGRGGGWVYDRDGKRVRQFPGDGGATHQANFTEALRSRQVGHLRADILEGHVSAALCHMGNISYRLGRREPPETVRQAVRDHPTAAEAVDRLLSHLEANEIDLETNPLTLGPTLTFDGEQERFVDRHSEWANMYLKRNYREPYAVPEAV
jgi:predicted dehydrogenase